MEKGVYLNELAKLWSGCRYCSRLQGRKNIVFGEGNPDAKIVIVGEAPGATEDETGLPFVGTSGKFLDLILGETSARPETIEVVQRLHGKRLRDGELEALKIELRNWLYQDFFFTNTIMCRPPDNTDPIASEIVACNSRLMETIYTIDPLLIIACGRISAEVLLKAKSVNIGKIRGELAEAPIRGRSIEFTYPVMPIYHSSYLLRKNDHNSKDGDSSKTYKDVLRAMHIYDEMMLQNYGVPKPKTRPDLKEDEKE